MRARLLGCLAVLAAGVGCTVTVKLSELPPVRLVGIPDNIAVEASGTMAIGGIPNAITVRGVGLGNGSANLFVYQGDRLDGKGVANVEVKCPFISFVNQGAGSNTVETGKTTPGGMVQSHGVNPGKYNCTVRCGSQVILKEVEVLTNMETNIEVGLPAGPTCP